MSGSAERLADARVLYEAIDKLSEEQRQAIMLFEIMGFPVSEVARIQGSSTVAVKVRLHRARKRLRSLLEDPSAAQLDVPIREEVVV
jgi:RNA polymerase sigma-70 factor (ECF subfamily)